MTEQGGIRKSLLISLALHLLIGVVLLVGIDFSAPKRPAQAVSIIEATMIDDGMVAAQAEKLADMQAQQERARAAELASAEAEQKAAEEAERLAEQQQAAAEAERVAEQQQALAAQQARAENERQQVIEQERKAQAAEKAAQAKKEAEAKAAEAKKQAEAKAAEAQKQAEAKAAEAKALAAKKQAEAEAKKQADAKAAEAKKQAEAKAAEAKKQADAKAAEAKKQAEAKAAEAKKQAEAKAAEAKKQAEAKAAEAKKNAEAEQALKDLEALMGADGGGSSRPASAAEVNKYTGMIVAAIQRNWLVGPTMVGKQCVVNIRVATDGLILSIGEGQGDSEVCRSAQLAIRKTGTLPMPKDPEVNKQLQNLNLTLIPRL